MDIPTSDYELRHALQEYENIDSKIMHVDSLVSRPHTVLEDFVIVYLPNSGEVVGHWCLLSRVDDEMNVIEWFDPLSQPIPEQLESWILAGGFEYIANPVQLQDLDTNSCGKFIVSRLMSLPSCLCDYIKVMTGNKLMSANEIVEVLVKLRRFKFGR